MNDDAGVLVWVGSTLSGDHVLLFGIGAAGLDVTVLEDDGGVAKDEINGADDHAVNEKLTIGVDVKSILVG